MAKAKRSRRMSRKRGGCCKGKGRKRKRKIGGRRCPLRCISKKTKAERDKCCKWYLDNIKEIARKNVARRKKLDAWLAKKKKNPKLKLPKSLGGFKLMKNCTNYACRHKKSQAEADKCCRRNIKFNMKVQRETVARRKKLDACLKRKRKNPQISCRRL